MNRLPYGSLSPTIQYSEVADSVEQLELPDIAAPRAFVRPYLPVYDDDDNQLIDDLSRGAQSAVERYTGVHTTKRKCVAEFLRPAAEIIIPFGPHVILKVEQKSSLEDDYKETQDYDVFGLNFLSIRLHHRYMTKVTFMSGCTEVPFDLLTAIKQEVAFRYKNRNDAEQAAAESKNGLSVISRNALELFDRSQCTAK